MDILTVPPPLRQRLGDAGSDGLMTMFAEAHRIGMEGAERYARQAEERMRHTLTEELSKIRLEMTALKFDLLKWSFLFWIGQMATTMAMLGWMLRGVQ